MRRLLPLTLFAFAVLACTGPQQEVNSADEYEAWVQEGRGPEPQSVEWLYALQDYQGDRQGECVRLHQVLQAERGCDGVVCRHAAELGRDWLQLCEQYTDPTVRGTLEQLIREYRERAAAPPTDCSKQAEAWLAGGCGEEGACLPEVKAWATRCAQPIGSPLTLTMLEQRIETSYAVPHRVILDTRGCDALGEELKQAAKCRRKSRCEDELPQLERYRAKCVPNGDAMSPDIALAALRLLVATGQGSQVPVADTPQRLAREDAPLELTDGSGAVLQVCRERPKNVEDYLLAARGCEQSILVARFFPGKPHRVLRAAWVPHPDPTTFATWYPALLVAGASEQTDQQPLERFAKELTGAAQLAENHPRAKEPLAKLLAALDVLPLELVSSSTVQQSLADQDTKFVAAFAELGKQKLNAPHPVERADLHAFVHRSENLPLADLNPEGELAPGAATPGGALRLRRAMPNAFRAYFAEIEKLQGTIRFKNLDRRQLAELEDRVVRAAAECQRLRQERATAEENLLRCAFASKPCPEGQTATWAGSLLDAKSRTKNAWAATELALWSLPDDRRGAAQTAAAGVCPTP